MPFFMKLYFFSTLVFLFSYAASLSQSRNDFPAVVILKDGTALTGKIHLRPSRNTPQKFEFENNKGKAVNSITLTPENTKSVNIGDSIYYQSEQLRLYMNETRPDLISDDTSQSVKEGVFFCERAVKGNKLSLYTVIDDEKSHFIIRDSTGLFKSLRYVRYIDNSSNGTGNVRDIAFYKSELLAYTEGREDVQRIIMGSKFELNDLLKSIIAINSNNEVGKKANEETRKRKFIYPYAEATLIASSFNYTGIPKSLDAMSFSSKLFPKIAIGGEMHIGRKEKTLISLSAGFYPFTITGKEEEKNSTNNLVLKKYDASGFGVVFNSWFEYVILRNPQSQLAAGIGYSFTINHFGKNEYISDDKNADGSVVKLTQLDLGNTWAQYSVIIEYFINRKGSLYFNYAPAQDFASFMYSTFTQMHLCIGARYRF
jgi:hypothetical protein